jgi:hypothetical protein
MTHYRHTQFGTLTVVLLVVIILFQLTIGAVTGWHWIIWSMVILMALLLLAFHSLTVDVDRERIKIRFGWGPFGKTYAVSEVRGAREVTNRWFYGWGIRLTPHGWLYNISGFDAVEVEFAAGKKVRIGTNEPRELLRAVRRAARLG